MSTGTGPTPTPRRRAPRRAVRPPGTVGTDESVLRSTVPAAPGEPPAPVPARSASASASASAPAVPAAPVDAPDPWTATRSADDSDRGWGREEPSSNEERLRRERPPHW
ncbi:hypothetical protein AB6N23_15555 [Cellulomonas sp. 179-A 9B4 NHS]|uniref:hypothetical protein n=1 Tax=Cellulomonas sp. 179-A 9B4 NHS TaxID=3142379 RepID=UPI00399F3B11